MYQWITDFCRRCSLYYNQHFAAKTLKNRFASCGENVTVSRRFCVAGPENISVGSDVYINENVTFFSSDAKIRLGNKILISPNVSFITGNHRTDVIGAYMYDVKEKEDRNDMDIVVEDDVWIGTGAILLKGTTIGRGSVIGAGCVLGSVTVPPYSICLGNPGRVVKKRFTPEQIQEHEQKLGILKD